MSGRTPVPLIEIHRVCFTGSGPNRNIIAGPEWESHFRNAWGGSLQAAGLSVEVYVWDDFHDRYLISNLVGISIPNGFDTTPNLANTTTWTRLGRREAEDIGREFEPASNRHTLHHRFRIPG